MQQIDQILTGEISCAQETYYAATRLSLALLGLVVTILLGNLDQYIVEQQMRLQPATPYQADFGSATSTFTSMEIARAAGEIQPQSLYPF